MIRSARAGLRERHTALDALPDTIAVPSLPPRRRLAVTMPIEQATLDDVAFALGALEAEFNAVADRLHALKTLYRLAREAGAVGADRAVAIILAGAR